MSIITFVIILFTVALAGGVTVGICASVIPDVKYRRTHTRQEYMEHLRERARAEQARRNQPITKGDIEDLRQELRIRDFVHTVFDD